MTRYKSGSSPMAALCVHGGTTATVVVVLDARYVFIANVGDSTAILAGQDNPDCLRPIAEWKSLGGDAGASGATPASSVSPDAGTASATIPVVPGIADPSPHVCLTTPSTASSASALAAAGTDERATSFGKGLPETQRFLELSADHSPESAAEFFRMRAFRPCPHRLNQPELLFVYDTLSSSKLSCPPVFVVDSAGGVTKTGRGSYYKNVRNEWATLVATPPYCQFQDALAFTRSLGDLHLQTYGVSYVTLLLCGPTSLSCPGCFAAVAVSLLCWQGNARGACVCMCGFVARHLPLRMVDTSDALPRSVGMFPCCVQAHTGYLLR